MSTPSIRRISLYSGPGAGKSTLAAYLFARLKMAGQNVELVHEWIKRWVYEDIKCRSFDQLYVFSKQLRLEDTMLRNDVSFIVTDSPLILQCAYIQEHGANYYDQIVAMSRKFEEAFPSLNIFLDRKNIPYQEAGRYQNFQQALEMDLLIRQELDKFYGESGYVVLDATQPDAIVEFVRGQIDGEKS